MPSFSLEDDVFSSVVLPGLSDTLKRNDLAVYDEDQRQQ
jgi:hypothetical protein